MATTFFKWALSAILCVFGALAVLVAFIAFTAHQTPPRHSSPSIEQFEEGNFTYRDDAILGGVPIAGSSTTVTVNGEVYYYKYGEFGDRLADDISESDPKNEIVQVGGSIAWGQGVKADDVASNLVANKLGLRSTNLAVPGTGTTYSALRLEQIPQLEPKHIIYLLYEDHIFRNIRLCAPVDNPLCIQMPRVSVDEGTPELILPNYGIERLFGGVFVLMQKWYTEQYAGSGRISFIKDMFWTGMDLYTKARRNLIAGAIGINDRSVQMRALDFSIARMAQYTGVRSATLTVVYIPYYVYPARLEPLPSDVGDILSKHGAKTIDMTDKFNELIETEPNPGGQYVWAIPNDGHLNKLGHSLIADQVLLKIGVKTP